MMQCCLEFLLLQLDIMISELRLHLLLRVAMVLHIIKELQK